MLYALGQRIGRVIFAWMLAWEIYRRYRKIVPWDITPHKFAPYAKDVDPNSGGGYRTWLCCYCDTSVIAKAETLRNYPVDRALCKEAHLGHLNMPQFIKGCLNNSIDCLEWYDAGGLLAYEPCEKCGCFDIDGWQTWTSIDGENMLLCDDCCKGLCAAGAETGPRLGTTTKGHAMIFWPDRKEKIAKTKGAKYATKR